MQSTPTPPEDELAFDDEDELAEDVVSEDDVVPPAPPAEAVLPVEALAPPAEEPVLEPEVLEPPVPDPHAATSVPSARMVANPRTSMSVTL